MTSDVGNKYGNGNDIGVKAYSMACTAKKAALATGMTRSGNQQRRRRKRESGGGISNLSKQRSQWR